jgi:hypothetical protein
MGIGALVGAQRVFRLEFGFLGLGFLHWSPSLILRIGNGWHRLPRAEIRPSPRQHQIAAEGLGEALGVADAGLGVNGNARLDAHGASARAAVSAACSSARSAVYCAQNPRTGQ